MQLASWEVDWKRLSGLYMLDCALDEDGQPSDACRACERPVSDLPTPPDGYEHWPACPNRLRLEPMWQSVVRGWNTAQVCPLSDWPHGYVAWYVRGMTELHAAFGRKAEQDRKRDNPPPTPTGRPGPPSRRGPRYGGPNPWQ